MYDSLHKVPDSLPLAFAGVDFRDDRCTPLQNAYSVKRGAVLRRQGPS
jgi:hypothetical protein